MGDVVALPLPPGSPNEAERQRFEKWASGALRRDEAEKLLARDRKGAYVNRVAVGGWAAWQARGMIDAEIAKLAKQLEGVPSLGDPPYD